MLMVLAYVASIPIMELLMSCCWSFDVGGIRIERALAPAW